MKKVNFDLTKFDLLTLTPIKHQKFSQPLYTLPPKKWQKPHGPSPWFFKPCASMDITLIWKEITIAKITGVFVGRNLLDRSQKGAREKF
jgi:hypothetical protein